MRDNAQSLLRLTSEYLDILSNINNITKFSRHGRSKAGANGAMTPLPLLDFDGINIYTELKVR